MFAIRRVLAVVFGASVLSASCGTDAVGTDACRRIEQARCRRAPACPTLLLPESAVTECVQFARDQCLHGLAVADPGPPAVDACASAVENGTCEIVQSPELAPACAFLVPAQPDSGSAEAGDAEAATNVEASTSEGGP